MTYIESGTKYNNHLVLH